jgi:AcrR family transcriptional regulator
VRTKTPLQAEKILDAAARLFGTRRFHEVRMDDIAAEVGVGKGTLFRYFRDKEDLYLAVLDRASDQFVERVKVELARHADPRAGLIALVHTIIAYFDEHPHLLDLIQRAEVLHGSDPNLPWRKTRGELMHLVVALFHQAQARGDFVVHDPELASLMLLGGLRSVIRFGPVPRPRDLPERLVDAYLHGQDVASRARL